MTATYPVNNQEFLTMNKGKMNIEEKQEVVGTKKYLLFLMSQFESKERVLRASLIIQVLKLRERFKVRKSVLHANSATYKLCKFMQDTLLL